MQESQLHTFVFINGLHRSGTSIIHNIIRDNQQFSGFRDTGFPMDEGQFLQTVYKPGYVYGGPGKFAFKKEAFLDENSSLITPRNAMLLFEEWSKYWNLEKTFLIEKSPPNIIRSRFLQSIFPNSYFINVIRHPVATSFATEKWSHSSIKSMLKHWLICYEKLEEDKAFLKNSFTYRFEDFVMNPMAVIDQISSFLGTEIIIPETTIIKPDTNKKYEDLWKMHKSSLRSRILGLKWIDELEPRINKFGYSLIN